ncbi:hypothetical protein [Spirosoma sp.]|uniref:hypothetical protein n=1 Tax=Spirosoma sp. TaxID=1899569 RepID=UPI003B3AA207
MKQKPDEMPDAWVRQSLRQLPDAPPPDSAFDSERLWAQLRPELQARPVRRRMRWIWLAAACLAGLVLSWFFWQNPHTDQPVVATHHFLPKPSVKASGKAKSLDKADTLVPVFAQRSRQKTSRQPTEKQYVAPQASTHVASVSHPIIQDVAVPLADSTATTIEPSLVAEKTMERSKPNVTTVKPKRRFRLMHENELRAEEEAAPKIYRTDHFVRIGSGRSDAPVSEPRQTEPPLSLTTKKSQ